MKGKFIEKGTVIVLFVLVQIVFSFAERDSKKLVEIYNTQNPSAKIKTDTDLKASSIEPVAVQATIQAK